MRIVLVQESEKKSTVMCEILGYWSEQRQNEVQMEAIEQCLVITLRYGSLRNIHLLERYCLGNSQLLIYFYSHEIFITAWFLTLCSRYYRLAHSTSFCILLMLFQNIKIGRQNTQIPLQLEFGHVTWFWPIRCGCNFWGGLPYCIKKAKMRKRFCLSYIVFPVFSFLELEDTS